MDQEYGKISIRTNVSMTTVNFSLNVTTMRYAPTENANDLNMSTRRTEDELYIISY